MQNIKSWFYGLQRRERWMVAGGAVIVVVTVLYLFVLEPFYAAVARIP